MAGGDISAAYQIRTEHAVYFLKLNSAHKAMEMFQAEARGLEALGALGILRTPEVVGCAALETGAFLILEYIASRVATESEMAQFGYQLAELHRVGAGEWGWTQNNFIGSLPQSNLPQPNWCDFYIEERLMPQFQLAIRSGKLSASEVKSTGVMRDKLSRYLSIDTPSLLHGDLWSGNFLISESGEAVLIDPAVYRGHNEVDLAMSRLFGGFGSSFYKAYEELIPSDALTKDRIALYQLYYLLVHLNLFGSSYYGAVKAILKSYF